MLPEILYIVLFIIIGYTAGIAAGMMGIGGGVIFVPALYFFLPLNGVDAESLPITAISTSLFAGSFASSSSAFNHFKLKNIDVKKAAYLAAGSIVSSLLLPRLVINIDPTTLKMILSVILLIIALKMLLMQNAQVQVKFKLKDPFFFFFGILIGALAAFGGIGGGVVLIPLLIYVSDIGMKKSIGTSSLVVAITMLSTVLTYFVLDYILAGNQTGPGIINLKAGLPLGLGALFGARYGVKLVSRYSSSVLKKIFSLFLLVVVILFFITN